MKIIPITSESNRLLKLVKGLSQRSFREKTGFFLIEGAKVVDEALAAGLQIQDILVSQSFLQSGLGHLQDADINQLSVVEDQVFDELATTDTSCGILAVAHKPIWEPAKLFSGKHSLLLIADSIQDPGNLGTMIRTALAANSSGMILTKGSVDPYNPKVVRAAAGALFALPLLTGLTAPEAIALAKKHQLTVIACCAQATQPFWESNLIAPTALVFGNEGQGFTDETLSLADQSVSIPMARLSESLNVAVATGIILFGVVQQRLSETR